MMAQISGRPTPGLEAIDNLVQTFMADSGIQSGIVGIMRNGNIVYLKGFGPAYGGNAPLPENALTRLASVSKPITVAAVRRLISQGMFTLQSRAFNVGQPGGGLLNYVPFPSLGDTRFANITVEHLISHQGGWSRNQVPDPTYREFDIAIDMGIASPPGRVNTVRWILGQSLQFSPGDSVVYSNVGCLVLGLIVEQFTGVSLTTYIRDSILTPTDWVPTTEVIRGRTFRSDQDPREMYYREPFPLVTSVYPPYVLVERPYGGWDHEARIGQGGHVLSAPAILEFAQRYHVGMFDSNIGMPINAANPLTGSASHSGSQGGVNTNIWQRKQGGTRLNTFVALNKDKSQGNYAVILTSLIVQTIDGGGISWPSTTSDGFWTVTNGVTSTGVGGYNAPFGSFTYAFSQVTDGSKLRLSPGSRNWTGTITKRLIMDAPLGVAILGQ
jgi:CubicO group peptidase (beta-lactamase class C family)